MIPRLRHAATVQNHSAEVNRQDNRGRDVLRQCAKCSVIGTTRVVDGRVTFDRLRVIDGRTEVVRRAEHAWQEAEHKAARTGDPADHRKAQAALHILRDARRLRSVELHAGCGGRLLSFDIREGR